MTKFEANVKDTARALNISENEALVLEFINMAAWSEYKGDTKNAAVAHVAGKHASGQIDGNTYHSLMDLI